MKWTVILIGVGVIIPLAGSAQEDSEGLSTVSLDEATVFSAPDGSSVEVAAGSYGVRSTSTGDLQLIAADWSRALVLRATNRSHDEKVDDALALLISADESPAKHLLLLLPDGELAEAVGNAGGVTTRGKLRLSTKQQIMDSRRLKLARLGQSQLPSLKVEAPQEPQEDPVDPPTFVTQVGCVNEISIHPGADRYEGGLGGYFRVNGQLYGLVGTRITRNGWGNPFLTPEMFASFTPVLAQLRHAVQERVQVKVLYFPDTGYVIGVNTLYDRPCP